MASEDTVRDAPTGDSRQSTLPNQTTSQPTSDLPTNSIPTTNPDAAGPNRRDNRNRRGNDKCNANGRRRVQDFKRGGSGRDRDR